MDHATVIKIIEACQVPFTNMIRDIHILRTNLKVKPHAPKQSKAGLHIYKKIKIPRSKGCPSAYQLFVKKETKAGSSVSVQMKILGPIWKEMSEDKKRVFRDESKEIKASAALGRQNAEPLQTSDRLTKSDSSDALQHKMSDKKIRGNLLQLLQQRQVHMATAMKQITDDMNLFCSSADTGEGGKTLDLIMKPPPMLDTNNNGGCGDSVQKKNSAQRRPCSESESDSDAEEMTQKHYISSGGGASSDEY